MNPKIKELITVIILQLVITLPFYTASVYGLTISNVKVAKVTSGSATIEWDTDNMSDGRVKYGRTASLGFTQRHDNFVDRHSITVYNGIESDAEYFFAVESTDLGGSKAIDNNSDSFYKFKTPDITPPQQVTGLKAESATPISIFLSWDSVNATDIRHYVVYKNRIAVANATKNSYNDTDLASGADFSYKVSAVDNSGNEGPQSSTLIASASEIDLEAPVIISVDVLPITDTTARITWLTNENSTTTVLYGLNRTDKSKSSGEFVTNHSIVIPAIVKNARHVFTVKSCDKANNCANSSNQSFIGGKDVTPPFINLSIPRFVDRRVIDITGTTEPFSSVALFVNSMNVPKRSLSSNEVGNSGRFAFSQVQLEQDNIIKIALVDKSGNKNQKVFEVSIDTENPIVQLNDVPPLTSKTNLTLSGTVNEPSLIKVFVDANAGGQHAPQKVTGLSITKVGQNSVEMKWDELKDKDFSHYVVYREGIGAIAITKPSNFNMFIDALVDSGKSYTYSVSAVSIFGKEGAKSEPAAATTQKGGAVLNIIPNEVDAFEDFRKPLLAVNSSGSFSFGVKLSQGDKAYKIKIIFEDRAKNSILVEKSVTLDTKKPDVKVISPPPGAFIFENVANEVDIIGKTEPNSRVHLFVDRTPFSLFNKSFEITGLPNEVQDIPEAKLDAKCRFNVASKSFCSTGADFSVAADEEGNFRFNRVDLTVLFGGAGQIREVPVEEFRDTRTIEDAKESKKATLVLIATDPAGQRGTAVQGIRIGTCWSGNQSWSITPLTQYQSPSFISTERLAEGTETIYFYMNYSYIGRGSNAKITGVSLSKACSVRELMDSRFNISCQILPSGDTPVKLNRPENTLSYSAIPLNRLHGMDEFLENDWEGFFNAINRELTFPFKIRVQYEHEITDENGEAKKIRETQTTCEQMSYVVDNSIIDPRKVLPDWLLFDFVDFLQDSIKTLTNVQEQIGKVLDYVAVGCLSSFGVHLAVKIYRNWMEFADEKLFRIKDIKLIRFGLDTNEKNEYCKSLAESVKNGYGSLKLKYFSDADLKKCFPSSAAAWEAEAKMYQLQRWSCDRIFGHAAPSAWTETENDEDLHSAVTSPKTCESDASVRGQPVRAEKCRDIEGSFTQIFNKGNQPLDKKCFKIQTDPKSLEYYVYTFDDRQEAALAANKIYRLTRYEQRPTAEVIYAVKVTDDTYMTKLPKTCAELCGIKKDDKRGIIKVDGEDYSIKDGVIVPAGSTQIKGQDKATIAGCVTVNQCREWHAKSDQNAGGIVIPGKFVLKGYTIQSKGYSSDCFYEDGKSSEVVSDTNPNLREECCCINGKSSQFKEMYYQPDDVDARLESHRSPNPIVHESKSAAGQPPKPQVDKGDPKGYSDMKWSYRYSRIGYLDKKYNPNRYTSGRDMPACLGQNNLFYTIFNKEKEVLTVDPFKQSTAAVQCLYLTGVNQRLQLYKNIMSALSNCLIEVRSTGRADTGVCKELFAQYVCGLIWQGVRWFIDGCTPFDLALDAGDKEEDFADTLRMGFRGIRQGISEAQKEIAEEYGNAKLNNLLGTGEEGIARKVCLAAFGYDWEINARNLVDAAYSAPFATLVQAVTRSREFLTVDPVSLKPKYEYRTSWVINPGCDFERYDIQLACVSRKELDEYPNSINCGSIGAPSIAYTGGLGTSTAYNQCDCLELPQEATESFFSESRIKQNSFVDKNYHKVVESNRRYDHLKFTLRPDRKISASAKPSCFPTGYDKGVFYFPLIDKTARDIADCTVDISSGLFICGGGTAFFSRKGTAQLTEVTINGENADKVREMGIGDPLRIGARVTKTGNDKCLRVSVSPDSILPVIEGITQNGTTDVAPITVTDSLRVAGRTGEVIARGISYALKSQNNQEIVAISAKFFDRNKVNEQGYRIYDADDRVIIDGHDVNLKEEGFSFEDDKIKIRVSGTAIVIEKEGAVLEIKDAAYSPQTKDGDWGLQEIITVNPPQYVPQASQQKTILVELFHLKGDRDSYNGPDDCDFNDKITERTHKITISLQKGTDARKLGPAIQNLIVSPRKAVAGQAVNIRAHLTHSSGIDKASLAIVGPGGNTSIEVSSMPRDGDDFEYSFDTNGKNAGKYRGNLKAVSRAGTASDKSFEFEVAGQK